MKKIILLSISILCYTQCSSQKKELTRSPKIETSVNQNVDENYFIGNWHNVSTYFTSENKKVLQPQLECEKNSYWKFLMKDGLLKQSKFTAKGEYCNRFITTTFGKVTIKNNMMNYFVDDVNYTVKIQIISPVKFAVINDDYFGGKFVSIEKIYTKK